MKKNNHILIKLFSYLIDLVNALQVTIYIYAFLCITYWFFKILNFPIAMDMAKFFEPTFAFVQEFAYPQAKQQSGNGIDLTAIVTAIILVLVTLSFKYLKDYMEQQKEKLIKLIEEREEKENRRIQLQIEQEYYQEMSKYSNFILLIDFNINKIKSYIFEDSNSQIDLKQIKQEVIAEIFNSIDGRFVLRKEKYKDTSFYVVGMTSRIADFLITFKELVKTFETKYNSKDIIVSYELSFDAITAKSDILQKLSFLQKIINLHYNNAILTTALFKNCYNLLVKLGKLKFTTLGKYQFTVDGKIENYELYSVYF